MGGSGTGTVAAGQQSDGDWGDRARLWATLRDRSTVSGLENGGLAVGGEPHAEPDDAGGAGAGHGDRDGAAAPAGDGGGAGGTGRAWANANAAPPMGGAGEPVSVRAVWGAAVALDGSDAVGGGGAVAGGNGAAWAMGNDGNPGWTIGNWYDLTAIATHFPTCPPSPSGWERGWGEGIRRLLT